MLTAPQNVEQSPAYRTIIHSKHRTEWLQRRLEGVGASEVAGLLGHGRSPLQLWALKTGRLEPDSLDDVEFVRWGHVLEPIILSEYQAPYYSGRMARRNGWLVQSTAQPWAMCTLDGWTNHPEHGLIPLEIKTTNAFNAEDWAEGAPPKYHWQLAHQMLVTGTPAASIACLIGGQRLVWADVERDPVDEERILEAGDTFWQHVVDDTPPPTDGSRGSAKALAAMYPRHIEGKSVQLNGVMGELDAQLIGVKSQLKALESERRKIENELRAAIGDAETAFLPDGTRYTLKTQTRAAHEVAASTFRVLRRKGAK